MKLEEPQRPVPVGHSTPRASKADIVKAHTSWFNQNYYFEITHSVDPDQLLYRLLDTDRKINTDCRAPDILCKINFN